MDGKCVYQFHHPDRPRATCQLPTNTTGPFCSLHSSKDDGNDEGALNLLCSELASPNHWLEGIVLPGVNLPGFRGLRARLPHADLQGANLRGAMFAEAVLFGADLSSASLQGATLSSANLGKANLTAAHLEGAKLIRANINEASLETAYLTGAYLHAISMSATTNLLGVNFDLLGETTDGDHIRAASIYRQLRTHFDDLSDYRQATEFYYKEMDSLHRAAWIAAPSLSLRLMWSLHRWVWGYGVRPVRTIWCMFIVVFLFGFGIFPFVGVQTNDGTISHNLLSGLSLSVITFSTLGYGNKTPVGDIGELFAGVEALTGSILISTFLVALATTYVRQK